MIKNNIIYSTFSNWTIEVVRAKGSDIWDKNNNKLLDFTSAWNVTNLGWNHPEINQAVIDQVKKNTYVPGWTSDPIQNKYAKNLVKSLPKKLSVVYRATGGTEANDVALQTARAYTKRKKIIGFKNTYHGHSFGCIAISSEDKDFEAISPLVPDFIHLDFPTTDLDEFGKKLEIILKNEDVACIVTEAGIITGGGSTEVAPKGFLKLVRKLSEKYGTLLVLDEVGTGFSRCGKLFGMEIENIVPDIATFAKGMSNGAQAMGAMVTSEEICQKSFNQTSIYSTFGWMPAACAASLKTLEIHKRDKIWQKAEKDGNYLKDTLKKEFKNNPKVTDINGIGMEIGIKLTKVDTVVLEARKNGLFLVSDNVGNIQIMPPLTIERKDLDKGIEIFIKSVKKCLMS